MISMNKSNLRRGRVVMLGNRDVPFFPSELKQLRFCPRDSELRELIGTRF